MIDDGTFESFGIKAQGRSFDRLAPASSTLANTLTFVESQAFAEQAARNANIAGVIALPELAEALREARPDLSIYPHPEPRWTFFQLHNAVAGERHGSRMPTVIDPKAVIDPAALVAPFGVVIGGGTRIAPGAVVLPDVTIGQDCVIQSGAVLGSEGFELKRQGDKVLSVIHDGEVILGNRVEIGANACIDKGFADRPTKIADDARICVAKGAGRALEDENYRGVLLAA